MSYSIDENGFIKLSAMAPKQELGRQLELRSRLARSAGHSGVADNLSTLSGAVASPAGDVTGPMAAHSGLQSLLDSTKAVSSARLKELGMGRNFGDFHNTRAVAQDVLDRPEISRKSGKTDYNPLPKTKPLPTYKKASYTVENGLIKLADKFTERMHAVKRPQRAEAREQARKAQGRSTAAEGADIRARAAEETASKRQDAARRRAAEASKYDDQFGLSYHARTGKNPPKLASYEIDENGLIKLSAMAPQQELSRQLLVASRHPKATPADRARLEQRSNRLGLGQLLPPENLKAMEGRIHGVSGQGLTELGRLSLPKTASYEIDENGFIKLAASRQQMMALQSIPVAQRRTRGRPTGKVKDIKSVYEMKRDIAAMTPADKSRARENFAKSHGIEFSESGGLAHLLPDKPTTTAAAPPEIMGMTDYGSTQGGTTAPAAPRLKTPSKATTEPQRKRAEFPSIMELKMAVKGRASAPKRRGPAGKRHPAPPREREPLSTDRQITQAVKEKLDSGNVKHVEGVFEPPKKTSSFELPLTKHAVAGLPVGATSATAHRGVGKALASGAKGVGKGLKKGLVAIDKYGPGESIVRAKERAAARQAPWAHLDPRR